MFVASPSTCQHLARLRRAIDASRAALRHDPSRLVLVSREHLEALIGAAEPQLRAVEPSTVYAAPLP